VRTTSNKLIFPCAVITTQPRRTPRRRTKRVRQRIARERNGGKLTSLLSRVFLEPSIAFILPKQKPTRRLQAFFDTNANDACDRRIDWWICVIIPLERFFIGGLEANFGAWEDGARSPPALSLVLAFFCRRSARRLNSTQSLGSLGWTLVLHRATSLQQGNLRQVAREGKYCGARSDNLRPFGKRT